MGLKIDWQGDDLANLIELPNPELYRLYGDFFNGNRRTRNETIRRKANHYRKLIKTGKAPMPKRSYEYDPQQEPERIEARRRRAAKNLGSAGAVGADVTVITVPNEHLVYHEQLQEALNADGRVERATFQAGEHTGFIKNSDNEIEYTEPMKSARAKFEVNFNVEPKWPVPTRVESIKIGRKERKENLAKLPKTDIIADLQWPFVDHEALDVACQILRDRQPDTLVIGGDLMDLSAWSKYQQMPEWATVTQQSIIEIHQFLEKLRKMLPTSRIVVVEGNHEKRVPDMMLNNAKAAYGLKRANQLDSWPVMSIPYLTAMDDLDIEYIDGFPANTLWITPELQFKHRAKGRGPSAVAGNERYSTIYGDNHRVEASYKTYPTMDGAKTFGVFGTGALCRLDGHTPGVNSGRHLDGTPVTAYNDNWQHGIMLIDHHQDGSFNANQVFIDTFNGYKAIYNGRVYTPTRDEPGYA